MTNLFLLVDNLISRVKNPSVTAGTFLQIPFSYWTLQVFVYTQSASGIDIKLTSLRLFSFVKRTLQVPTSVLYPTMAEYIPVVRSMGVLPEFPEQVVTYDLKVDGGIPGEAKEVFVYLFVTTHGEGEFQRGYYEISTSKQVGAEKVQYAQYLNVATGQGIAAVNSANMWFPVTGDGLLTVKLIHAGGEKKSIAAKMVSGKKEVLKDWSEVFVIGYRM